MTYPTKLRRFLLLLAFLWWQGGFAFYAAVVVPIGTDELGNAQAQGAITQRVTVWLNLIGVVWHVLLLWDILAQFSRRRLVVLLVSFVGLVALFVLHPLMVNAEPKRFRTLHITYLWISTLHWLLGMLALWQTLGAWMGKPGSLAHLRNN
jgi:hypothetical protein